MSFFNSDFFPFSWESVVSVAKPPDIVSGAVNQFNLEVIGRG